VFDNFLELGIVKVLRLGVITATVRNILNSFNSDQETCVWPFYKADWQNN